MSEITKRLDKIASSLEEKGLLKEAEDLDIIANTVEAMEKEAWNVANSKQYGVLGPALNAAMVGNVKAALGLLKNGEGARKNLALAYSTNENAQGFSNSWIEAVKRLENADTDAAVQSLNESIKFLRALEPVINSAQAPGQKPPSGEMIFPAPGVQKGTMGRAPLPHPARAMR